MCSLLAEFPWDFAATYVLSTPGITFVTASEHVIGLPESPNPFGLPRSEEADVTLVTSYWHQWVVREHPDALDAVFSRLDQLEGPLVGLDCADDFRLDLPPEMFDRFELVLKAQGVYRDRDLYNYLVGTRLPGANWTEKRSPRDARFSSSALEKLRVSVPCMMRGIPRVRADSRALEGRGGLTLAGGMSAPERYARNVAASAMSEAASRVPIRWRSRDVQCLVGLSHAQRIETLRLLRGFSGTIGITSVPEQVAGTDNHSPEARAELDREAAAFRRPGLSRLSYVADLSRHKIAVAPTGYGELTFRHGEALHSGAALVCQSLAHVDTLFPFDDGRNVLFCRPDQADLPERVRELLADDHLRRQIAANGRHDFLEWAAD